MARPAARALGTVWRSAVGAVASALVLLPTAALAQRLELRWDAPPSCPEGAAVHAELERLLGGEIPEGPPIVAEARAIDAGEAFELTLRTTVEGVPGERALRAERCEDLAAATALILALMIDPEAVARAEPESMASRLAPPGIASGRTESERHVEPPRTLIVVRRGAVGSDASRRVVVAEVPAPEPGGLRALLGGGIVLDVGTLPSATPAIVLEGGLGIPLVDARIRAVFLFPQVAANEGELPGAAAELMGFSAGLAGCLRPIEEARAIGICADISAGSVFGSARGISAPRFGGGFWMAAGGGLALAWQPEPWFALEGMAVVLGQISAPSFEVVVGSADAERRVLLWAPPGVTGRFSLAAHVRF